MAKRIPLMLALIVGLGLTGCSAATPTAVKTSQATEPATPTPSSSMAQSLKDLKAATGKMTSEQQDTVYLAGVRSSIKTGTDANLIATGHKMCADLAAGMDMTARVKDVVAAGYAAKDGLLIVLSAGLVYCKS